MALVKQENGGDFLDDTWLSRWSNNENEVKSEDIKPTGGIKAEVLEGKKSEEFFVEKISDKFIEKTRKYRNRNNYQENKQQPWKEALNTVTLYDSVNDLCKYQCQNVILYSKADKSFVNIYV